jgi:hypothetical protein
VRRCFRDVCSLPVQMTSSSFYIPSAQRGNHHQQHRAVFESLELRYPGLRSLLQDTPRFQKVQTLCPNPGELENDITGAGLCSSDEAQLRTTNHHDQPYDLQQGVM